MKYNNISTNIVRDQSKDLHYVVTQNAVEIFQNIFQNNNKASKSFTIIGNYGTGKSTFLWALEKNLSKKTFYFTNVLDNNYGYDFFKIVGESNSISNTFAAELKLDNNNHQSIIDGLEKRRLKSKSKGKDFVILIDEFGKFLEQINKTANADDLYLIQLIAEWANDDAKNVFFLITLHQDFNEYSSNLGLPEKREWEKVKGRFKELVFNEPVEQLIYFAAQSLTKFDIENHRVDKFNALNDFIKTTTLFKINDLSHHELTNAIYPLDFLSVNVLVNSLQRYGQNERSLFSFLFELQNTEQREDTFYTIDRVFDYLTQSLASEIHSYKNPHRNHWQVAFRALDRAELLFQDPKKHQLASKLIKAICLLNIFAQADSVLNDEILSEYYTITSVNQSKKGIANVLESLKNAGIIRYYHHSKKLNFLEGTDLDIEQELADLSKEINPNFSIENEITDRQKFPILPAKRYSFNHGSNRYFEFRVLSSLDETIQAEGSIDGYINLIFNETIKEDTIMKFSIGQGANLFVLYKNTKKIRECLFILQKLALLIVKRKDDYAAKKLIQKEIEYYQNQLENLLLNELFTDNNNEWFFNGDRRTITNKKDLNVEISRICEAVFSSEPILRNELINREVTSSQVSTARKRLLQALLYNSAEKNLGFENDKFPPEKAIYLSLFENTGIHRENPELGYYELGAPTNESSQMTPLWQYCELFFESAISSKRNLEELYSNLSHPPFKLKKGFLDMWVLSFLIIKKDDYALFHEESGFIPYLDEAIFEFIYKNPSSFSIKSYKVEGLKLNLLESYKELVQINTDPNASIKSSFLTVYASFLRFYNSLNEYSKKTNSISAKAIKFRDAINDAKDPEDALFNLFPQALGFNGLDFENNQDAFSTYIFHINDSIKEIREAYDQLLQRIEQIVTKSLQCESTEFSEYKKEIANHLQSIQPELLEKQNNIFFRRLISPIDDRESWLKSVADVALNKPIDKMIDYEEVILMNNLKKHCENILNITDLHDFKPTEERQMVSITLLDYFGNRREEKVIVDQSNVQKLSKTKSAVSQIINNLEQAQKKQLLYELLNEELK